MQNQPYWIHETMIGKNFMVSIRCPSSVDIETYDNYISDFISKHNILHVDKTYRLSDLSLCTMIKLNGDGRLPIHPK